MIDAYTFALVCAVLGGPAALVANLLFGDAAAEWVFAGVVFVGLIVGLVVSIGSWKIRVEGERRARGLCPRVPANRMRCRECGRAILRYKQTRAGKTSCLPVDP